MSRYLYSVEAIEAELLRRLKDLLADPRLGLSDGERRGHEWTVRLPGRTKRGSMAVNLNTGVWSDFSGGTGARTLPCLALVSNFVAGGDFTRAIVWAKEWLGWGDGHAPDPAELSKAQAAADAARARHEEEEARKATGKLNAAFAIYLEARHLDGTDPASRYLQARGLELMRMPEGRAPRCLKFHPAITHPHRNGKFPALIACMSLEGKKHGFAGIHRIYLEQRGGEWKRWLDVDNGPAAKVVLAYQPGASIRISAGASKKKLAEAPAGEWVMVTEGIEDGLALAIACPEARVLSVYALPAIGKISLPPHIGGVTIVADNDPADSQACAALERCAEALAERHALRIARMPAGFKDVNDALIGKRTA